MNKYYKNKWKNDYKTIIEVVMEDPTDRNFLFVQRKSKMSLMPKDLLSLHWERISPLEVALYVNEEEEN